MRKCLFILIVCSVCRFCVAQEYDTIREDTQNVTNSCYVLTKDFIDDIIFYYDSNNEHYSITVLLSAEGVNQVSALTDNFIQFIQMDTIPVKIPIFLAYSSLYAFEPIIYGYDWDGKFLLENDNTFSIHFNKSFLLQHPDFLEQLDYLKMKYDFK